MSSFPNAEDYERSRKFMPWGLTVNFIIKTIRERVPSSGRILDMMCGPGHIARLIQQACPRLEIVGVDCDSDCIAYAKQQYSGIKFITADARTWPVDKQFDCVLVNAGTHHLPYKDQPFFLDRVRSWIKQGGLAIIADPYIAEYEIGNELSRREAALELGYHVYKFTSSKGAPLDICDIALDIMVRDMQLDGEFKSSASRAQSMMNKIFSKVSVIKTWPLEPTDYGEYCFIVG